MNDRRLKKQANSKHVIKNLQDYTFDFEETPHTVFRSKWIRNLTKQRVPTN